MNDPVNHPKHYTELQKQQEQIECSDETKTSTEHTLRKTYPDQSDARQEQHTLGVSVRLREHDKSLPTELEVGQSGELRLSPGTDGKGSAQREGIRERVCVYKNAATPESTPDFGESQGAHCSNGENSWTPSVTRRAGAPQERSALRQSAEQSGTVGQESAGRGESKGLGEMGGRNIGEVQVHDSVNHPRHYTDHKSGIECIQITEHMGFCLGNAVKYIWRADLKGDAIEDLSKARWYIDREIEKRLKAREQ